LWFCICLPNLPLEACRPGDDTNALAIVEEQHGIHRVLQADTAAEARGIMAGQSANAALALLPTLHLVERSPVRELKVQEALATWLERFSSFVSIADKNVLLLEVAGSLRLFGGLPSLRQQLSSGLRTQGFMAALAIAPTPLAATWLARAGRRACIRATENVSPALRQLPLSCLDWPPGLCTTLTGMGVTTVGDCLRLPREGFARRFGPQHLLELDRALGHLPDPRDSWRAPERFCADYEMTEEQTDCTLLLNICRELLLSHERFLLTRQLGTQALCFSFFHLKTSATEVRLNSVCADRSATRWLDLLSIRFENVQLPEPVIAVRLRSGLSQALQAETGRLRFDGTAKQQHGRRSIAQLAERLIARIGAGAVNSMMRVAEHRPEYAWRAQSPMAESLTTHDNFADDLNDDHGKRPLWMLSEPALLRVNEGYPFYKGHRLAFLGGPERLETGWWDAGSISRDYYTAVNAAGMRLWVFRNRQSKPDWYLHGIFG
jgi:protein ImuB